MEHRAESWRLEERPMRALRLEAKTRAGITEYWNNGMVECWAEGREHREIISNCGLRNREPARRVGVRRTISDWVKGIGHRAEGRELEVGGAALRALRLEAKIRAGMVEY